MALKGGSGNRLFFLSAASIFSLNLNADTGFMSLPNDANSPDARQQLNATPAEAYPHSRRDTERFKERLSGCTALRRISTAPCPGKGRHGAAHALSGGAAAHVCSLKNKVPGTQAHFSPSPRASVGTLVRGACVGSMRSGRRSEH